LLLNSRLPSNIAVEPDTPLANSSLPDSKASQARELSNPIPQFAPSELKKATAQGPDRVMQDSKTEEQLGRRLPKEDRALKAGLSP
jgi:hypothetical protein